MCCIVINSCMLCSKSARSIKVFRYVFNVIDKINIWLQQLFLMSFGLMCFYERNQFVELGIRLFNKLRCILKIYASSILPSSSIFHAWFYIIIFQRLKTIIQNTSNIIMKHYDLLFQKSLIPGTDIVGLCKDYVSMSPKHFVLIL